MRLPALAALFLMLVPLAGIASSSSLSTSISPKEAVEKTSREVMTQVEDRREEFTSDPRALYVFAQAQIDRLVDKDRSARLALGLYSRNATDTEIQAFADALANNLAARYGAALLDFDGTVPIRVISQSQLSNGRGYKVATRSLRRKGGEVDVDYFIREVNGTWRVFDVHIAGFSYTMTLKSMFAEELKTSSISQVAEKLNRQTDRMLAKAVREASIPLKATAKAL